MYLPGIPVSQQQNSVRVLSKDWEGLENHNKEMEMELAHIEKHGKNEDSFFLFFFFRLERRSD